MKKLQRFIVGITLAVASVAASADTITYYHNDMLGSPRVATDATGKVLWRESYKPYGERDGDGAATRIGYAGHAQDPTGLVYMGARYYDPVIGRFLSVDSFRFNEANVHSFNRYAYANNNPYTFVDPDGNNPLLITMPPPVLPPVPGQSAEIKKLQSSGGFQPTTPSWGDYVLPGSIVVTDPLVVITVIAGDNLRKLFSNTVFGTSWTPGPNDADWRGTGRSERDALNEAFSRTGESRGEFQITKWGKSGEGKSLPVEWRHPSGAEVNIDTGHKGHGPSVPHVGWQTGGKRGSGGATRGHVLVDDVRANR